MEKGEKQERRRYTREFKLEAVRLDPATVRLALERYAAPNSVAIKYPNGVTLQQHWPQEQRHA
jgi:transposase-like protein